LPFSVLEVAVNVANVLAAPLAGLLLLLDGVAGLKGWQWLFVAEGAPSIALGLLTFLLLPNTVQRADWLTGAEKKWLTSKVPVGFFMLRSKWKEGEVAGIIYLRSLFVLRFMCWGVCARVCVVPLTERLSKRLNE